MPKKISFLHLVPFSESTDAKRALDDALELFEYAEELGLDGGWVFTRHLQHGLSSPVAFLSAASQRTRHIDLGAAVIPIEHDNVFRLAEDLSVADLLSDSRLQIGVSVHDPKLSDTANRRVFGAGWAQEDYSDSRVDELVALVRGAEIGTADASDARWLLSNRVEPHVPDLADRIWRGGGSLATVRWAAERGMNLLLSNVATLEGEDPDYATIQANHVGEYLRHLPAGVQGRISQGLVFVPTDNAGDERAERYRRYVQERADRTRDIAAQRLLFAPDLAGSTEEIVARLSADATFQAADQFLAILPFTFEKDDYFHILHELATSVGPALGWTPRQS